MSPLRTVAFFALMAGVCSIQDSDCSTVRLLDHLNLMKHNDMLADVRPVHDWRTPTNVTIDAVIIGILEVDEKEQTLTTHSFFSMTWMNEFLNWNSTNFCGIKEVPVRRAKLWTPDILTYQDTSDVGSMRMSPFLTLKSTGMVYSSAIQRLTSTCELDLNMFPFDRQTCFITFSSMSAPEKTLLGTTGNDTMLTSTSEYYMATHGEWALVNITITSQNTKLEYKVTLERKPMLYFINLIVPLCCFLLLDLSSFFISGVEKLSFKVTILLSISVLLLILQDMLPSTEDTLPMMAMFCLLIFLMVGCSLMESIIVGFLLNFDPHCGKKAQYSPEANLEKQQELNHQQETNSAAGMIEEGADSHQLGLQLPTDIFLLQQILDEVKREKQECSSAAGEDQKTPGCFKRVVKIMDFMYFVLYAIGVGYFLAHIYWYWFPLGFFVAPTD
ncbi:5-hydroxytryptamine receptor 3A [Genypterus blacodes]|uniref:5-hydroxytryptamine receptor 3A n=1 Tax=Genypterus blacodes TaxID=154954 RepID=UPI003F7669EE